MAPPEAPLSARASISDAGATAGASDRTTPHRFPSHSRPGSISGAEAAGLGTPSGSESPMLHPQYSVRTPHVAAVMANPRMMSAPQVFSTIGGVSGTPMAAPPALPSALGLGLGIVPRYNDAEQLELESSIDRDIGALGLDSVTSSSALLSLKGGAFVPTKDSLGSTARSTASGGSAGEAKPAPALHRDTSLSSSVVDQLLVELGDMKH